MEQIYNKHYIRHDEKGNVIKAFSDAFERPLETDICVNEEGGRHFNPVLFYEDGCPIYKGMMELRTEEENTMCRTPDPIQAIHNELEELDKIIPRWGEDALEGKHVFGKVAEAIQRKQQLRTQLEG